MTPFVRPEAVDDLSEALAALGPKRHALKVVLVEQRDEMVSVGEHALARVWNELACLTAETEDSARRVADDLERLFALPAEPQEPPC